ncbi:MAG: hypothetical protein IJF03_05955 [Lachnospiraceae bacterium]|nr:hypothetical protein [Lachnospiraceae bacterium]
MNELLGVMIGVLILIVVSFVISLITRNFSSDVGEIKDIYVGKLENTELSIQDAMKELKLRNSIK